MFRAPDTVSPSIQSTQQTGIRSRTDQPSRQFPVAALLPQNKLETLPVGRVLGISIEPDVPAAADPQVNIEEIVRRAEAPPLQRTRAPQPTVQQQVQRQTEAIQTAESAQARQSSSTPPMPESLEADWPRLQNILHLHEQRNTIDDSPAVVQPSESESPRQLSETTTGTGRTPAPVQRQADSRPTQVPPPSPGIPRKTVITEIDPSSRKPVTESLQPDELLIPNIEEPDAQEALPAFRENEMLLAATAAQEVENSAPIQTDKTLPDSPAIDENVLQRASEAPTQVSQSPTVPEPPQQAPTASPERVKKRDAIVSTAPSSEQPQPTSVQKFSENPENSAETAYVEKAETIYDDMGETQTGTAQHVPLESVWPVQRQDRSPADTPTQVIQPQLETPIEEQDKMSGEEIKQIQNVLQNIAVDQSTDSHIELITPRKPRPKALQISQQKPALQKMENELESQPSADIQDIFSETSVSQPEIDSGSVVQKTPAETELVESVSSSSEIIQKKAISDPSPISGNGETPGTIETEIGPLPADLWQLMGETPPNQQQDTLSSTGLMSPTAGSIQPKAIPEVEGVLAAQRQAGGERPAVIQRTQAESSAAAEETGSEQSEENAEEEGKVDTDELARKVYAQIKRRLSVEWERLRRRF